MRGARPWVLAVVAACGTTPPAGMPDASPDAPTAGSDGSGSSGAPTAQDLLDAIATCDTVVGGTYAADSGGPSNVSICGLTGAVFWQADLDVDCDGKMSAQCNLSADPDYQSQTAATDSNGDFLDAAALPYVVIPAPSSRFDFRDHGLKMGSLVAVIANDKVTYAVLGDVGPAALIGEASYATAASLGIDPDPSTGGAESGVAYIAFTGSDAVVDPIQDHDAAVTLGVAKATALLQR